jgi:hypothetical protein
MSDYNGIKPKPWTSREEMTLWMSDPRMKGGPFNGGDENYQRHCQARSEMTPDALLGVGTDLNAAMTVNRPEYQDLNNTLGGMTDTYRDMSEARRDQSSSLYKESAFERERVAQKIGRSVPDEAVRPGKQQAFHQAGNEGEGGEEGEQ